MQVRVTKPAPAITERLLATLDDGASEGVAPPCGGASGASPGSSKVAKSPIVRRRLAFVSRNVRRRRPSLARPRVHQCAPLQLIIRLDQQSGMLNRIERGIETFNDTLAKAAAPQQAATVREGGA